jgi:membrane protease subunit (stomatin/prohibitin family)
MAIIDIVKYQNADGELCHKFESDDLRLGTQLVVHPAQTAFFIKGGVICDEFTSGTYRIDTQNIPILNKIMNLPYGSDSPFQAEVWFVNQTAKLNLPWGTPHPIQVEDPRYHIIVPLRAHGQYGIRITNPRLFIETLIGNMGSFSTEQIDQFYKGKIISALNTLLAQQVVSNSVSVLDINTLLLAMSDAINSQLNEILGKYGVSIIEFAIMSVTFPQDDESVIKLKNAKDLAARLAITGRDVYQMERSFDVMEKAASNEGAGGQMMGLGVGLGAGMNVGNAVGNIANQYINTNPQQVPPIPNASPLYYLAINGQQVPNLTVENVASYIANGIVNESTLAWTSGMQNWLPIAQIPTLASLVNSQTPPPLP